MATGLALPTPRDLIAEHERVLATQPADLSEPLRETSAELQEAGLSDIEAVTARTAVHVERRSRGVRAQSSGGRPLQGY